MTALATSATNTNTPSSFSPDTIDNTSSNNNNSSSLNKITNNNSNSLASFLGIFKNFKCYQKEFSELQIYLFIIFREREQQ